MIIAIYPDDYTDPKVGKRDSSSPIWADLLQKAGHEVRWVNVCRPDILGQVKGCDGFMWRHAHQPQHRQIARRLLPVLEHELGLAVYPNQATCWHYDDKIAQYYLLSAAAVPMPKTWLWFDGEAAVDWVRTAEFPLVIKLWSGAGSENVRLVRNAGQAEMWIKRLFGEGVGHMKEFSDCSSVSLSRRLRYAGKMLLKGQPPLHPSPWELHKNYVLFQEFLPNNSFDTRIVVIGKRAFGKRRYNRTNDFRASGSGSIDTDRTKIDIESVRLAFRVAKRLRVQSLAFDILRRGKEHVVVEISYAYPSWGQQSCPGHWELEGKDIIWKSGHMWPEQAQIEDFLVRLEERRRQRREICV